MTIPVDTWLDLYLIPPTTEVNGTPTTKRLYTNFVGALVTYNDDTENASADIEINPLGTGQSTGVLPVDCTANAVTLSSLQAGYQGLRLTGAPTAAVTVAYPTPVPDANGASGGVVAIINSTTFHATISVIGGTGTIDIPPKSGATMTIDTNGAYLTTTTAGPP